MPEPSRPRAASSGNAALRAHHAMARQLALTPDSRRALIARIVPGKTSAGDLDPAELDRVNAELRRLGAGRGAGNRSRPRPAADRAAPVALARALWLSLHQLGAIDDPSDDALDQFVRRQTASATPAGDGLPLAWCTADDWPSVLEALWAIAERHGWLRPTRLDIAAHRERRAATVPGQPTADHHLAQVRLVEAQWRALLRHGEMSSGIFPQIETWLVHQGLGQVGWVGWLDAHALRVAAQRLGRWLRRVRAERAAQAAQPAGKED